MGRAPAGRRGGSAGSGDRGARRGTGPQAGPGREEVAQRVYDPRREERRQRSRVPLPDDVEPRQLDPEVRQELRSLSKDTADVVARHLVMTGRLLDDEPTQALTHARAAGALAGRIGVVREAVGLAAYAAGEWAEALSELRAARRITGRADSLPVMADCERALGRPERALAQLDDPDVPKLEQAVRVELVIVAAGARRDLGQAAAAVLLLQGPAHASTARRPWATRLWYAMADALLDAGRHDEAREWFAKAAEHDGQGETDAMERLLELDGVVLEDLLDGEDDEEPSEPYDGSDDLSSLLTAPPSAMAASAGQPATVGQVDDGPAPPAASPKATEVALEPRAATAQGPQPAAAWAADPFRVVPFAGPAGDPVPIPGPTRRGTEAPGVAFVAAENIANEPSSAEPSAAPPAGRVAQAPDGELTLFD